MWRHRIPGYTQSRESDLRSHTTNITTVVSYKYETSQLDLSETECPHSRAMLGVVQKEREPELEADS